MLSSFTNSLKSLFGYKSKTLSTYRETFRNNKIEYRRLEYTLEKYQDSLTNIKETNFLRRSFIFFIFFFVLIKLHVPLHYNITLLICLYLSFSLFNGFITKYYLYKIERTKKRIEDIEKETKNQTRDFFNATKITEIKDILTELSSIGNVNKIFDEKFFRELGIKAKKYEIKNSQTSEDKSLFMANHWLSPNKKVFALICKNKECNSHNGFVSEQNREVKFRCRNCKVVNN